MFDGENRTDAAIGLPAERQYTAGPSARHRSSGSARRRLVFFGLASIWGFIVGVVGLLAAIGVEGQHLAARANSLPALIAALLLAGTGGLVVAAAYKESKRRAR